MTRNLNAERAPIVRDGERTPVPYLLRQAVLWRDHHRCRWCSSAERLELDHLVPWSAGGTDIANNLRVLCHDCNTLRSNRLTDPDDVVLPIVSQCLACQASAGVGSIDAFCVRCNWISRGGAVPRVVTLAVPHQVLAFEMAVRTQMKPCAAVACIREIPRGRFCCRSCAAGGQHTSTCDSAAAAWEQLTLIGATA